MSGGHYNYYQRNILDIVESIEEIIENNRKPVEKKDRYFDEEYYHDYPDEVIEKFKEGIGHLKIAYVYAQRIDWLISGDDGEESFLERLKNDLEQLNNNNGTSI